jgi:hypothetical protein
MENIDMLGLWMPVMPTYASNIRLTPAVMTSRLLVLLDSFLHHCMCLPYLTEHRRWVYVMHNDLQFR